MDGQCVTIMSAVGALAEAGAAVAAVMALSFLLAPVAVWRSFRQSADPAWTRCETGVAQMPPRAAETVRQDEQGLRALGFFCEGYWSFAPEGKPFRLLIGCWRSVDGVVRAGQVVTLGMAKGVPQVIENYLKFSSRLQDGGSVDTSNRREGMDCFAPDARYRKQQFGAVRDAQRLWRLHCRLLDRESAAAVAQAEPVTAQWMKEQMVREFDGQVEAGYLRLRCDGRQYRATWPGAFLMTWKLLPPIRQCRAWGERRQARRLLLELER